MNTCRTTVVVAEDTRLTSVEMGGAGANRLGRPLVAELHAALDGALQDPPSLLVLAARGPTFSGGFDLAGLSDETDETLLHRFCRIELLLDKIDRAPFPVVALVEGPAVGAGADLVVACSHRWASGAASLRFPGAAFGAVLGTERLARVAGRDLALRLTVGGELLTAADAATAGVWRLFPDRSAMDVELLRLAGLTAARGAATTRALLEASRPPASTRSLGALVHSLAGVPGLHHRLTAYAAGVRGAAVVPAPSAPGASAAPTSEENR